VAHSLLGSNYKADGDHRKASKVIYEVVMGEGQGEGKEGERVIPLGRDMLLLMDNVFKDMHHQIETFREIGNSVYVES
jgi:hypothetical protein